MSARIMSGQLVANQPTTVTLDQGYSQVRVLCRDYASGNDIWFRTDGTAAAVAQPGNAYAAQNSEWTYEMVPPGNTPTQVSLVSTTAANYVVEGWPA